MLYGNNTGMALNILNKWNGIIIFEQIGIKIRCFILFFKLQLVNFGHVIENNKTSKTTYMPYASFDSCTIIVHILKTYVYIHILLHSFI